MTAGALPAQDLFDNGTNGDEKAGDGICSFLVTVAPGTTAGSKSLPIRFSDPMAPGPPSGGGYVAVAVVVSPLAAPDHDNCATAQNIPGPYTPPVNVGGNLTGSTAAYNPITTTGTPPNGMSARRGLWYTVTGTGNSMTASLCPTSPTLDTVMPVMCGTCDGLTVVGNDDDFCASLGASQVTWCSTSGTTYCIWVAPFAMTASTASFTLRISDNGVPCAGAIACTTCMVMPGPSPIIENEAGFGPGTNDGCDSPASQNFFTDLGPVGALVKNIVGTARVYDATRETDWYRLQAPLRAP